jgi:hypothetical protein
LLQGNEPGSQLLKRPRASPPVLRAVATQLHEKTNIIATAHANLTRTSSAAATAQPICPLGGCHRRPAGPSTPAFEKLVCEVTAVPWELGHQKARPRKACQWPTRFEYSTWQVLARAQTRAPRLQIARREYEDYLMHPRITRRRLGDGTLHEGRAGARMQSGRKQPALK